MGLLRSAEDKNSNVDCDNNYGHGLLKIKDAYDLLKTKGCAAGGQPTQPLSLGSLGGCEQIGDGTDSPTSSPPPTANPTTSFPTTSPTPQPYNLFNCDYLSEQDEQDIREICGHITTTKNGNGNRDYCVDKLEQIKINKCSTTALVINFDESKFDYSQKCYDPYEHPEIDFDYYWWYAGNGGSCT